MSRITLRTIPVTPRRPSCIWMTGAIAAALFLSACWPPTDAHAQPQPPAPPVGSPGGGDPDAVLANINDLGLLKAILPVGLTDEQIKAILVVLRELEKEGLGRVKQDTDTLRAIAGEVAAARTAALAGTPIPADLEARVAALNRAALDRQRKTKTDAVRRVMVVVKAKLTAEQQQGIAARAEKALGGRIVPREFQSNPKAAPPELVQDMAVARFVDLVLLNERVLLVLSQLKPAASAPPPAPAPNL